MTPAVTHRNMISDKVADDLTLLFLSDLHGVVYGKGGEALASVCRAQKPDLILCGGDMISARNRASLETSLALTRKLVDLAPVFMVNGNHETFCRCGLSANAPYFPVYVAELEACGARFVNNQTASVILRGTRVLVTGFEAEAGTYQKLRRPRLDRNDFLRAVGRADPSVFSVLLVHNPAFWPVYRLFGADLTLAGHYHGGVMRLPHGRVLISPYGRPFAKYGYGHFREGKHHLIVSSGLGDHAMMPPRIRNPRELVVIQIKKDSPAPVKDVPHGN